MFGKILKSPFTIIISVILGILFGLYEKEIALSWGVVGDVYLNLFQMTVIPILVTSIVASLAKLMKDSSARRHITKILLTFLIVLFAISLFGTAAGYFSRPGSNLGEGTTAVLDKIIKSSADTSSNEMALYDASEDFGEKKSFLVDFFVNIVPSNIFKAFSNGIVLQLVFFSIIFGVAIGFIEDDSSTRLINGVVSLKDSFQKLINWTMYALPFGLVFLMGKQIAQVGVEILLAMVKFIVVFYLAGLVVIALSTLIIWIKSGIRNPLVVVQKLIDPLIISFATRNSFASLPSSVASLKGLGFNANMVDLVFPLGLTVLRFGNIMYFAIASCFVSQIYNTTLSPASLVLVVVGSLLAGTATAGASGLLTLPMISLILDPIGLPVESILIVFMAIDSLIDPMRTLLIVYSNIATTALVSSKQDTEDLESAFASKSPEVVSVEEERLSSPIAKMVQSPRIESLSPRKETVRPARKNAFKIRIRDSLVMINTVLLILTAVVIMQINSHSTHDSVYSVSEKLVTEILKSVDTKLEAYYTPASQEIQKIVFHYWQEDSYHFKSDSEAALEYFMQVLDLHSEFAMIYFSDTKGNLIMARRMLDGSKTKRYITRTADSVITNYVHENRNFNASFPNTVESLEKGYDPRTRGWYKKAVQKKQIVWTNVYIFATDNMPGFSCAAPIYDDNGELLGVACIDIGIRDLSLYLGNISTTEHSKLFIYDQDNQIIAKPIRKEESINTLLSMYPQADGSNAFAMKRVDDRSDPIISAAFENSQGTKDIFSFSIDNENYFCKIDSMPLDDGLSINVGMVIPDEDIMGIVYKNNRIVLIISLSVIIVAIVISIVLASFISKPMNVLATEMDNIRKLDIAENESVVIDSGIQEIDTMVDSFEGMKQGLVNFKKYVPSDLVSQLIKDNQNAKIGGKKQVLTLLFSDIENFTGITEQTKPEELVSRLYDYFSIFAHSISENKGTIDKYIGDSIMAFWGAPTEMDVKTHAHLACKAALSCQIQGFNLSNVWAREGKPRFRTRFGIHTGEVVVGNMGSDERINYTVLGDNVNLASRLEGINKYYGTEIIVSATTHDLVKDDFEFRVLDKITVKGKTQAILIYELLAEKNKLDMKLLKLYKMYETGLKYYFIGDWDNCLKYMSAVIKNLDDSAAKVIKERAENFKANPPKNWSGVYAFDKK